MEMRLLAREQAREVERLRALERMKTEFFNAAAHELGTPLTPIRLQIHFLKGNEARNLTPDQERSLEILDRNVERLSRLARELMDVARLNAGHMTLQKSAVDAGAIVQEVLDTFQPVAVERGVRLDADLGQAQPVVADAKRIGQVFYNLVNNALKFTPKGGRVFIEGTETDREHVFLVHDTGLGLTKEQIASLFKPFSQVHESAVELGTGLGLVVCRGIVELHGGRIWCESGGPGAGSTFGFALPRQAATKGFSKPLPPAALTQLAGGPGAAAP